MLNPSQFMVQELIDDAVITAADADRAKQLAAERGVDQVDALVEIGAVTSDALARSRAKLCEYPYVDLATFEFDAQNADVIPKAVAERYSVYPIFVFDDLVILAMVDPLDLEAIDRVRSLSKLDVDPVVCDSKALRKLIDRSYGIATQAADGENADDLATGEEPIVLAVNQILAAGVEAGASDVHINPDEHELHLRYRVDGTLISQPAPSKASHAGIVQRLKVLARLDLAQTRKPQDGKFRFNLKNAYVDIRLSVIPTIHGENVVMRLLRPATRIGGIDELGMPPRIENWFEQAIERPYGLILVTGPTGSGKTTTLYTALNRLNRPDKNIMTIEDPVEIRLPMVRQVQVHNEVGLTFGTALRSILRQDPDIVLLGEIRDEETARIACQAALTGHLVLSTLHTNDAPGAIARLRDFGVPPFAINNALLGVFAQRLVRRVCEGCTEVEHLDDQRLSSLGLSPEDADAFVHGTGCGTCLGTGTKGRAGVYELLAMTPKIHGLIESNAPIAAIREAAIEDGYEPLWKDALRKARQHVTSVEEFARLRTGLDVAAERIEPARASEDETRQSGEAA